MKRTCILPHSCNSKSYDPTTMESKSTEDMQVGYLLTSYGNHFVNNQLWLGLITGHGLSHIRAESGFFVLSRAI